MEVRFESMVCLWDDKIPTMFLAFNLTSSSFTASAHIISTCTNAIRVTPKWLCAAECCQYISNHLKTTIMSTRMTINGVSTCTKAGTEKYEKFQTGIGRRKRTLVQYDYRHTDGELFSCVKPTLDECRAARDKWLNAKKGKEDRL